MHVASTTLFEGPPPSYDELCDHIDSRLHLVPRFRQKLRMVPLGQGRPKWVDDPHFNLRYHIRHTALPAPGSLEQLRILAARVFSQRLDRSKPLWEMWLIDKVEGGRFALVTKSHHALVDGVSGVDITTVLFDAAREPESVPEPQPWTPRPEPSDAQMLGEALVERATSPAEIARGVRAAFRAPRRVARAAVDAAEAAGAFARTSFAAPELAVQRRDRALPALRHGERRARGDQAHQELRRRHRQRRRPRGGRRSARALPAGPGLLDPRPRAAGDGPDQRPRRRRARRARQPGLLLHGAASGLVRQPARAAADGERHDGRPQAVQAGGRARR